MIQLQMIEAVRAAAEADERVAAVLMYGSFTQGCGDAYSDIEFYVYINDDDADSFPNEAWVADIKPFFAYFTNEFGTEVAIFDNLVRGEFHFKKRSEMPEIEGFKMLGYFHDTKAMCLYDASGELAKWLATLDGVNIERKTDENIHSTTNNMLNHLLLGVNVLKRGELMRSLGELEYVRHYYMVLARIADGSTIHWLNASKNLEHEISPAHYGICAKLVAMADADSIAAAYISALDALADITGELKGKGYMPVDYGDLTERLGEYIKP